jgi:uncharacterized 2Fe-2S/4Fe-4S cluster protein (DUF4445 family)
MAEDVLVVFTPSGKRGRFRRGTTILAAARQLGVDLDSVCGGRGLCGRCQVTVAEGAFAKHGITSHARHLSPFGQVEERYATRRGLEAGRRLGCSAFLHGDLVIDVPPESQVHKQVVRKRAEARAIALDPVLRLHYVEVARPRLETPSGDFERLKGALEREWGLEALGADLAVLQGLQGALREGKGKVTAAVHDESRIIALWPGFHERAFGIAFDVGSTTLAAHLSDLASGEVLASSGRMNPQIRFGEDLMSRVSYAMLNPGGGAEMTAAVRGALDALAGEVTTAAGASRDEVLEATIVGNPIMHHLVLGIDPGELGQAPFALSSGEALEIRASEIELGLHPGARVYVLPCIAGHVGADAAGVILSESPHLSDEIVLIIDVGTNAEILLGSAERLLAASSPTGPAFEGAQISCGQRAAPGAIERVRIDRQSLEPRFHVIGCAPWSDEPGFAEASRGTGVTGICGSGIIEALAEMYLAGLLKPDGTIDGGLAARCPHLERDGRTFSYRLWDGEPEIRITQNDVRAIQLAKAALYAGARLLMERLGVERVDRITLAGAFGSQIDVTYAMVLGMIPDCDLARVGSAGNAAGTGARIALLNKGARREIERLVTRVEKIETALDARFQEHFVEAMAIPHQSAPYPNLARAVELPPAPEQKAPGRSSRSRRRRGARAGPN